MTARTGPRYGAVAQILHWLIAALVCVMFGLGWYMAGLPLGQRKFDLYQLHKSLGLTIFALALARLLWRLRHPAPPMPLSLAPWERAAARTSHALLYALLLVQPLIGFLQSNAANFPVVLWGVWPLPALLGTDEALGETLVVVHRWNSRLLLLLIAVHAAAALRHHFVLKDDVLRRMLPLALAALLLIVPSASAGPWQVADGSRIAFTAFQQGSPVEGHFESFAAVIDFDPADLGHSRVEVEIETASITTGHKDRDATLRSSAFFDVQRWPTARFTGAELVHDGGDAYEARGALTMRDVTNEVVLPFELKIGADPDAADRLLAIAQGELRVSRLAFGVGQGDWTSTRTVGDEVVISIQIRATRPR